MLPVWFWTHVDGATHAENFLGGRFLDTRVNHENNKNKRPIEIAHYTLHIYIYINFIARWYIFHGWCNRNFELGKCIYTYILCLCTIRSPFKCANYWGALLLYIREMGSYIYSVMHLGPSYVHWLLWSLTPVCMWDHTLLLLQCIMKILQNHGSLSCIEDNTM